MSRQTSKRAEQQRFSGPDLGELLGLVVERHGSDAAIAEVNRVRSGGIAGFFCREEFEVVVDLREVLELGDVGSAVGARAGHGGADRDGGDGERDLGPPAVGTEAGFRALLARRLEEAAAADTTPDPAAAPGPAATPGPAPQAGASAGTSAVPATPEAGGDPAAAAPPGAAAAAQPDPEATPAARPDPRHPGAVVEPQPVEPPPEPGPTAATGPDPRLVGDQPQPAPPGRPGVPTPDASVGRPQPQPPDAEAAMAGDHHTEDTGPGTGAPAPGLVVADRPAGGPSLPAVTAAAIPDFWLRLHRAQEELDGFMPPPSPFVACIGPLALITPIVARLRSRPPFASADVVVLTDRTEVVSEPSWTLVRSGNQLVERAHRRTDRPTLLLIDVPVDLPNWVAPLLNRLRMAGVGLFRYAAPGQPTAAQLDGYRQASDVPYVLDLISRIPVAQLVDAIGQRHPIASVAGAAVTAELLVAMREQVGVER